MEPSLLSIGIATRYERHRPEATLLYQLVERHYPEFLVELATRGRSVPTYVEREFEAYLKCGRLEHGFLRVRCTTCQAERLLAFSCKRRGFCPSCGARRMTESAALLVDAVLPRVPIRQWVLSVPFPLRFLFAAEPAAMGQVLGIVYRAIARHLLKKAGLTKTTGQTGAVTLIQRFGSALNLNIHFHMLCLDGVYARVNGQAQFQRVPPPTKMELESVLECITIRIGRHLERCGLLVRDAESSHLSREPGEDAGLEALQSHSIGYRIAVGPHEGRKAFALQTVPACGTPARVNPYLANAGGFSLHAGVAVRANDRSTLERLCRYITRPALATGRLALTPQGRVRYTLKTPYRDGTTHVVFEPLDFIARLAALVPRPRVHLTRYHGVFAPHSALRAQITPAGRGTRKPATEHRSSAEKHRAMSWAQRLKRVFKLDLESCAGCGGQVRVIACIEDAGVIGKILAHLERQHPSVTTVPPLPARGPPRQGALELG